MRGSLFLDVETYCETPITYGAHRYAQDAEVMLFAFALGDGPVQVRDLTAGDTLPAELYDPAVPIVIHNSSFDRTVIRKALKIDIPTSRIHDTLVQARTLGLPGGLGVLCDILKVPVDQAKDKKGKDLIHLFCKPRPVNNKVRRATRETNPKEWQEFIEYARLDIGAMRAIYNKLPAWNYGGRERALWELDQKINDRGVRVDTELATAALTTIGYTKRQLDADTYKATGESVESATQRDQLLRFILRTYGVELPDMRASTLERRINDPELPPGLRDLLGLRLQTCTTSTAKYKALLNSVCEDGRLRGILEFCGAGRTARWAGRIFQPQNLPSRNLMPQFDIDLAITLLKNGCADLVYENLMKVLSSCIRGCIIASDGKALFVSDLANIEGRGAAWLAGEFWKVKAFRDYDNGIGMDLYRLSYARAFNTNPEDVIDKQRQIGKVMELMLQYEGGVGAFITGAASYNINLDAMAEAAWDGIPPAVLKEARRVWNKKKKEEQESGSEDGALTFHLKEKTYLVCDSLKQMWRASHPEITSHWKELKTAFADAINSPNRDFVCRKVTMRRQGAWLRIILPSGRSLCYAAPRIDEKGTLSYMGMNQYSRRWSRLTTYGGKIFENICQAVARDVMAHNMLEIELAGYEILFTCHDEVVTEANDNSYYSPEMLSSLLANPPPWGLDMPLAAKGFTDVRYHK